jgi:DNA-binding HxlR family transcriptional regulator
MQDGTLLSPANLQETRRGNVFARDCSTRLLLDRIGDKWSILLLTMLGREPLRFSELRRRIDGISQKMLSQTLRSLERDGLVLRDVEPTVPVTVTYTISSLGRELLGAMRLLIDWAETRMPTVAAAQAEYDRRQA